MDQGSIRLLVFISVLLLMASAEALWPRKKRIMERPTRWFNNLSLSVLNTIVIKVLGPITAIAVADYALGNSYGLIPQSPVPLPFWLEILIGFVVLDLLIYFQHVLSHKVPMLWRFHKVHHADRDIDVTTGIRFHPIEALFSMIYKCGFILILGPLPIAVFLFEVILNGSAMFNHANVKLPLGLDKVMRLIIVTPDMHRVHHSTSRKETNSNYGFFLSIWDRLFKTYIAQPKLGHDDMLIGLDEYQTKSPASLTWSLKTPFKKENT